MNDPSTRIANAPPQVAPANLSSLLAQDVPSDRSLIGTTAGSYRFVDIIGEGGIGVVYLAEHPAIGARVAIKVLHPHVAAMPEMGDRFLREAKATNIVDNPHVLRMHDFGKLPDGRDYAVMDYLRGSTLDALAAREERLEPVRLLRLLAQSADGIAAAHAAGIAHRDIKPSNLFVTRRGKEDHVFVLDFGIARLLAAHPSSTKTAAGVLIGTPGYCAPEQARQSDVGPPADVYSLGTVAFELLSGEPLFSAPTVFELLALKLNTRHVSLDALPPATPEELRILIREMLAFEPTERPTMQQVFDRLTAIIEAFPTRKAAPSLPDVPATMVSRVPEDAVFLPPGCTPPAPLRPITPPAASASVPPPAPPPPAGALPPLPVPPPPRLPTLPTPPTPRPVVTPAPAVDVRSSVPTRYGFPLSPVPFAAPQTQIPVAYTPPPATPVPPPRAQRGVVFAAAAFAIFLVLGTGVLLVAWPRAAGPELASTAAPLVASQGPITTASHVASSEPPPVVVLDEPVPTAPEVPSSEPAKPNRRSTTRDRADNKTSSPPPRAERPPAATATTASPPPPSTKKTESKNEWGF
jgi:serine/threonine-protein kinase